MSSVTTVLTDPKRFFEERDLDLTLPAAIVVGIVVLRIASAVVEALLLTPRLTGRMGGPGGDAAVASAIGGLIGGVFTAVVGPLIAWVLFSGIFYGISEVLADEPTGDFTDVLAVTAWGFVPRLITVAVALALAVVGVILVGPLGLSASLTSIVLLLAPLVGLGMTLWSAYVWGNGLAVVRTISPKQGYVTVAPIVLLGLLITVISIAFELVGAAML